MKKEILKLFKKYGFDSLKEPFLYEDADKVGVYYSFKDENYGILNRVFIPDDFASLEVFMQNYYAYKNAHCLKIVLSSYNDPFAKPIFLDDIELLDEDSYVSNYSYYQSADLIIQVIEKKLELSLLTYENVKRLTDKYMKLKETIAKKCGNSFEDVTNYNSEKIKKIRDEQLKIVADLRESLKNCFTKNDYKKFIDELVNYLKSIELEDSLLNNKYFMIKIPIEIEQLKEELELLDEYKDVKKKKKKLELEEKLKDLEEKYLKNKIISLSNFIKNEEAKINEKYEIISDLDYVSIGNYLVEFDSFDFKASNSYLEKDKIKVLNDSFEELSTNDKNVLYLSVFFRNVLRDKDLIKVYFKCLLSPINVLAKIKLFKDIDMVSVKDFEKSINKVMEKLDKIVKVKVPVDMMVYFEDSKIISDKIIICSSKKSKMPKMECSNPVKYLVNLKKGCLVNYVPSRLVIDYANDEKIVLKDGYSILIVDLEKNRIIEENNDIIKVAKIKILEKKTTDIITVSKIKTEEVLCYKKIVIERNENNG